MSTFEETIRECFPDIGDSFKAAMRSISSMRYDDIVSEDELTVLRKVGGDHTGIDRFLESLSADSSVAMEYLGPVTSFMPFDPVLCKSTLAGPGIDIVVISDTDGIPCGIIPLKEHSDRPSAFSCLKGSKYTIVTDSIPYSDENIRTLKRSGCDYILRQIQFPPSYGPNSHQKMLSLKHGGREYTACKCRFEKKWLFMFRCEEDAESVREAVPSMNIRSQDADYLMKSAGYEIAVSDTGHDIREVRGLIDMRIRTDRMMRSCRNAISSDTRLQHDRDAMIGFILAFVIGQRPEFR